MAKFTVDTHLFRELGELLVGRDSTALVELIKNAYDADATKVTVDGQYLDEPGRGKITITDDGVGMTPSEFEKGFLRIASRIKEEGSRKSRVYGRAYTGAKGIGRLAAHKLAKRMSVYSIPRELPRHDSTEAVQASIDWDAVEAQPTLEDVETSGALRVAPESRPPNASSGTMIELERLRRKWTPEERARLFAEVQTFSPPAVLLKLPPVVTAGERLFDEPAYRNSSHSDPGFQPELTGEFEAGDDYWMACAQAADWVIEIDASQPPGRVKIGILATKKTRKVLPEARSKTFEMEHPNPASGPFFQARILVREGRIDGRPERVWAGRACGIRVYMEGFRVLPYGEPQDDWLSLDSDYKKRDKVLRYLADFPSAGEPSDENEGLLRLGKRGHFGAVFLTLSGAPSLRMLVNREGFVPEAGFDDLVHILKMAIALSVRVRASANKENREERSRQRREGTSEPTESSRLDLRHDIKRTVERANTFASEARSLAATGDFDGAKSKIEQAASAFTRGSAISERLLTEDAMLQILASVGTQMAAFVHEINGLLGTARALEEAIDAVRNTLSRDSGARQRLAELHAAVGDLRRVVERQASYLTDVTSPDARRRRSRQKLAQRFDAGVRLVAHLAERRDITIENQIPVSFVTPPMFPAELTLVFSNLLTNAVKAAGPGGRIAASAKKDSARGVVLRIENTGVSMDLGEAERFFRPFESTTVEADPVLGQGMGMGLPITRNMLEDYGATICFTQPSPGFETAVEVVFPK